MAFLVSGFLDHLKASSARGLRGRATGKLGQTVLRGASNRAYCLEVYPREAASSFWQVGAVYCYARSNLPDPSAAGQGKNDAEFSIGYIGQTGNMGQRDAEHGQIGELDRHAFDVILILREVCESIRIGIGRDLIQQYRPHLNELLGSLEAAESA